MRIRTADSLVTRAAALTGIASGGSERTGCVEAGTTDPQALASIQVGALDTIGTFDAIGTFGTIDAFGTIDRFDTIGVLVSTGAFNMVAETEKGASAGVNADI
jgi:hypothetical protein